MFDGVEKVMLLIVLWLIGFTILANQLWATGVVTMWLILIIVFSYQNRSSTPTAKEAAR